MLGNYIYKGYHTVLRGDWKAQIFVQTRGGRWRYNEREGMPCGVQVTYLLFIFHLFYFFPLFVYLELEGAAMSRPHDLLQTPIYFSFYENSIVFDKYIKRAKK